MRPDRRPAFEEAQRLLVSLPSEATPAEHALALNLLPRTEVYMALTEPVANHAQLAFAIAKRQGDPVGQVEADLNVALNAVNQARFDALVEATTHSLTVLEGVDRPALLGEALLRMTLTYRGMGQFEEAVTMSMRAMEIARRRGDPLALTFAHQGLGLSFVHDRRNTPPATRFAFTTIINVGA